MGLSIVQRIIAGFVLMLLLLVLLGFISILKIRGINEGLSQVSDRATPLVIAVAGLKGALQDSNRWVLTYRTSAASGMYWGIRTCGWRSSWPGWRRVWIGGRPGPGYRGWWWPRADWSEIWPACSLDMEGTDCAGRRPTMHGSASFSMSSRLINAWGGVRRGISTR